MSKPLQKPTYSTQKQFKLNFSLRLIQLNNTTNFL